MSYYSLSEKYLPFCNVSIHYSLHLPPLLFKVYSSLKERADKWDAILPAEHPLRSAQLINLENSDLNDLQFRYVFFWEDEKNEPIAIAYFQWVHFTRKHYQLPSSTNFLLKILEKSVMRKGFQILICGNLFRVDFPGFYIADDKIQTTAVFHELEKFFRSLSPKPHAILIKDWQRPQDQEWVKEYGYQPWPSDLTMKLDLRPEWKSFDDYKAALKHKYAQRVRRVQHKCEGVIRKELDIEEIISYGDELEQLYNEVVARQVIRLVIVNKQYFIEMKKTYGDSFKIYGYFEDDVLIAFSSNILYKDLWELHYIGINYQKNEEHWLYFNIMYDGIALAIESGKKAVELGRTAREAKAMLGGKPIYFSSFFRLRGLLVNWLVSRFANAFNDKTGESWQIRNPWKRYYK